MSIIVQFRVVDPKLALHAVEKYEDRLYSDVQLAARRSLATMTLDNLDFWQAQYLCDKSRADLRMVCA